MRKKVFKLLCLCGFMLALGTAGASDAGLLSVTEITVRCVVSILLLGFGIYGLWMDQERDRKKIHREEWHMDV